METIQTDPFAIKDCALIAIATGEKARNLRELREIIERIDPASIYYHFWGGLLRPRFDDPEYHNDFAIWVYRSLHNKALAERLAVIDPAAFDTIENLRAELLDIMEDALYQTDTPAWAERDRQFEFIRSQIVVFNPNVQVTDAAMLTRVLPTISLGSIFFHFIDARQRNRNHLDDFRFWLRSQGDSYEPLCDAIARIDPYFSSLSDLRMELLKSFVSHFSGEQRP